MRRHVEALVKRVDQMEDILIARGRGRPRKTINITIKNVLNFNGLSLDMVFDRTQCFKCFDWEKKGCLMSMCSLCSSLEHLVGWSAGNLRVCLYPYVSCRIRLCFLLLSHVLLMPV